MTEGRGGFPGPNFFARPVVGGHFAFLALGRACGGRAAGGLGFLEDGHNGVEDVAGEVRELMRKSRIRSREGGEVDWEEVKASWEELSDEREWVMVEADEVEEERVFVVGNSEL